MCWHSTVEKKEKFLSVKIEAPEEEILRYLEKKVIRRDNPYTTPVLKEVVADSYQRLIAPAIERELRNELTEKAEDGAILVFGKNLEQTSDDAAADRRTGCAWMGSRIPYRMQACCGRSDRKSNRHDCDLSDSAYDSEEDPGEEKIC